MVALAVRYFWQKPVTCNARQLLHLAQTSLERGSTIEAGCRLREAMRSWLEAECEYNNCAPQSRRKGSSAPHSPRTLAFALKKAGHCPADLFESIIDIINVGNQTAHLVMVRPSHVSAAICLMHCYLDSASYLVESKKGGRS
jgi:hypothetical protein